MNNYRYYGNRRYASGDCGYGMQSQKPSNDCVCNPQPPKPDCGCDMRPSKPEKPDCGCDMRPSKPEKPDCGCDMRPSRPEKPDCGCDMRPPKPEKPDCGCVIGTSDRDKEGCCEPDMPGKTIGMAYVPWQEWKELYEVCEGFSTGTIFRQLNLEFLGRRCN